MKVKCQIPFISVCLLAMFFSFSALGQEKEPAPNRPGFWEKVRFGGGLGLNFGNRNTNITVAPSALYQPNQYVAFGPGFNYTYQRFGDAKTSLIGGSAIIIANPLAFLQLSGELEQLHVTQSIDGLPGKNKDWNTALFFGAGYRLNLGGNSLGAIGVRYNVLFKDRDGIYADAWQPFVRIYF